MWIRPPGWDRQSHLQRIIDSFPEFSIHRQTTTASLVSLTAQLLLSDFSKQDYIRSVVFVSYRQSSSVGRPAKVADLLERGIRDLIAWGSIERLHPETLPWVILDDISNRWPVRAELWASSENTSWHCVPPGFHEIRRKLWIAQIYDGQLLLCVLRNRINRIGKNDQALAVAGKINAAAVRLWGWVFGFGDNFGLSAIDWCSHDPDQIVQVINPAAVWRTGRRGVVGSMGELRRVWTVSVGFPYSPVLSSGAVDPADK
jgi:hypothetical protein